MMPLAHEQCEGRTEYQLDRDLSRWSEIFTVEVGGADRAFRGELVMGAAQGRSGQCLAFLVECARRQDLKSTSVQLLDAFEAFDASDAFDAFGIDLDFVGHRAPAKPSTWLVNLSRRDASRDPEVLGATMDSVIDDLMFKGKECVDADLLKVDVKLAHASHLMAVLRGLFSWRDQVPNWYVLRDRAAAELDGREMKLDVIMKGLMD